MLKSLLNININRENDKKSTDNDTLLNYFISSSKKIQFLSSFFNDIYANLILFKENISNKIILLKEVINKNDEKNSLEFNSKIDTSIQSFYDITLTNLERISDTLENFSELVIKPFNEFKSDYDNKSLLLINNLSSLKSRFFEEKNNILFYQKKYFSDIKEYLKLKKEINSKEYNLLNDKDKEKEKIKDEELLNKINMKLDIDKKSYKYQLDYFNYFYLNEFIKKNRKYYKELENEDKGRYFFLKNIIYLYSNKLNNLNNILGEYISKINTINKNIKIEQNKVIQNNFENLSNFGDINNDVNKEYQIMNKEIEDIYQNKPITKIYFNNKYNSIYDNKENDKNDINLSDKKENENNNKDKNEYEDRILNQYFEYLDTKEQIPLKCISEINKLILDNNNNFYYKFIEEYLKRHNDSKYIKMENIFNFNHLSFILQTKITLYLNNNIILLIILLGQQIYYSEIKDDGFQNKKIFLCNTFNNIPFFKKKTFWGNFIELTFRFVLTKENNINNETITNNGNNTNNIIEDSIIRIINDLSYDDICSSNESSANDKKYKYKEIENLITNSENFISSIIVYDSSFNKKKGNKEKVNEAFSRIHKIFLFYISSLINYNFGIKKSLELLINISNKFYFSNQVINYYSIYLKNYSYSIKNDFKSFYYEIKKNNKNMNNLNKNEKNVLSLEEKKIIISNVIKYLDNKNIINFIILNKEFNKDIKNKIYKKILKEIDINEKDDNNKKLNIEAYINIWKNILNYKEIKNLYPYEENKEKALKIPYSRKENAEFSIIDADCIRTYFFGVKEEDNLEQKRKSLNNILKTLIVLNKDSNYCQGMNYIIAFIISICNNEEEAFYLSLSLFKNTKYKTIFLNELKILRLYFAIFDKLLYIYLPTIYTYLNSNKISSNFYISAWFITLFSNLINKKVNIEPFIKIFNLFIIYGWKSIFSISLNIFLLNEDYILNMKNENLLQFLSSELCYKFINKVKNGKVNCNNNKIKISNKLINEIENEFLQFLNLINEYD